MRAALWWVVEVGIPAGLMLAAPLLLGIAALGVLARVPDVPRDLAIAGLASWGAGWCWGWLVNRPDSWLRRPF